MEFRFRAGDLGPPGSTSSVPGGSQPVRFSHPLDGYTGAQGTQAGPLPPPLEWQAARREHIIREEVTRRLTEEWAKGDLAFARGLNGGFGPGPFSAPDCFMPPPHAPMPMPMHPLPPAPPAVPFEEFGAWQGFGPRRHVGFGERTPFLCEERRGSPPRPNPKHKLKLLEIEPSGRPEALSPKVPRMKRKADANAATTVPKKVQKLAEDWSCALCQVSAPCEAGLNEHLGGRKHKAKLAQCAVSKAIKDDKNCSQTTTGNENSTDPCDAPKKICMLVDGAMHEVVRKDNYLWCDHCRVRCDNNATMACHLRCKKHSKLTKVCSSIKAARTNTDTKEGLPSSCGSQLKQQIQPRSLSDSCSSSRPGQLMMNRRGSTSASMGEKGKHTHTWTAAEELFLLTPFSTDPAAEKERFMASKSNYHFTAAEKMNEKFGDNSPGWVPFSADKIKSKLRNFADRYNYYREKGHPYVNKVPSEPYKQVEYYIALYGWIFVERPCPSRSGSSSRSRSPSASSRSVSKQQKTSHIPVNLDDEADIEAAGKYMLKHGVSDVNFFWYLKALHETIVRKGFWMLGDDFEKRKNYLDGLLPMLKKQWNVSE